MPGDATFWTKLEKQLAESSTFDRLLEQEEEMELQTVKPAAKSQSPAEKCNHRVLWLQRALNRVTRFAIAENGISSIQTRKALQKFQADRGLRPTGKLGPRTRAALIRLSGISAPRPQIEIDGGDFEAESFMPPDSCPADNAYVIRGFARYTDDVRALSASEQTKLAAIAGEITKSLSGAGGVTPITQVIVVGYDDSDTARESREPGFLQSLSEKRALAVGIDLECRVGTGRFDLVMSGRGARSLAVAAPRSEAEHSCNRRVEITLVRPTDVLPRLDPNQRIQADNRSTSFKNYYHIALQGTSGQYPPPVAEQRAREVAEKVVPFLEARVQETIQCGSLPALWHDVLQPYFQDALQGTASKYPPDEAISKAHEIARHSFLVARQGGRAMEWITAPLPQPMAADCDPIPGKVPGPANHLLCNTHGHVIDTNSKTVIAHDLEEYKKKLRR